MKLYSLETGNFKIDAGPMFGVIPKAMWSKVCQSDENNLCILANRCLLCDNGNQIVLIDTGVGNKVNEKTVKQTQLDTKRDIVFALKENGFEPEQITDVIFTHLHWDHCGGAVDYNEGDHSRFKRVFPNAVHHISRKQWEWALTPNKREAAAYPPEYIVPIEDFDLNLVDGPGVLIHGFEIIFSDGHTPGQMIPIIDTGKLKVAFGGDLVPSSAHASLLWISAYDVYPLTCIEEKEKFLKKCIEEDICIIFEHDPDCEAAFIQEGPKGPEIKEKLSIKELVSRFHEV